MNVRAGLHELKLWNAGVMQQGNNPQKGLLIRNVDELKVSLRNCPTFLFIIVEVLYGTTGNVKVYKEFSAAVLKLVWARMWTESYVYPEIVFFSPFSAASQRLIKHSRPSKSFVLLDADFPVCELITHVHGSKAIVFHLKGWKRPHVEVEQEVVKPLTAKLQV